MITLHLPTNKSKILIQDNIDKFSSNYQNSLEQLSSGNKYTSINENPIEYCKSSNLEYLIDTNQGLLDNINLGSDLLTIATGAEESVSDNVLRIRDLCLQAKNDAYSDEDKDKIIDEIKARLDDINFISSETNFNGTNLLDGSDDSIPMQLTSTAGNSINLADALLNVQTSALNITMVSSVTGANWTDDQIDDYLSNIDTALDSLTSSLAKIGNYSSMLDNACNNLTSSNINLSSLHSDINDTDTAAACSDEVRYQILQQCSVDILAQSNQMSSYVMGLLINA